MTRDEAVSFVRDTLGCRCPDDVLCAISRETRDNPDICWLLAGEVQPVLEAHLSTVLAVGGKLLVIVCSSLPGEKVATVLDGAVRLRDRLGFNRVRLSVPVNSDFPLAKALSIPMPDKRTHLHPLHRN